MSGGTSAPPAPTVVGTDNGWKPIVTPLSNADPRVATRKRRTPGGFSGFADTILGTTGRLGA